MLYEKTVCHFGHLSQADSVFRENENLFAADAEDHCVYSSTHEPPSQEYWALLKDSVCSKSAARTVLFTQQRMPHRTLPYEVYVVASLETFAASGKVT